MKTEVEVRSRLQALVAEELNRRLADIALRLPVLCVHNHRQPLDQRKQVGGESNPSYNRVVSHTSLPVLQTIGLCMLGSEDPESWPGTICEEPLDARRCPDFTPARTKADVLAEFQGQLADPEWVRANLPEVASLLWVLDQLTLGGLSWWVRLLVWLRVVRREPLAPRLDPAKLLELPSSEP